MAISNKFLHKNTLPILLSVLLMTYLYLGTPLPINLVLQDFTLIVAILVSIVLFGFLSTKVNLVVAIVFAIVSYEVIRKSLKPDLNNISKDVKYYENTKSNSIVVISDKLKDTSSTLEQEMVDKMIIVTKQDTPGQTARYQPLVADSAGSSQIE
jgi:hypothetical protein